MPISLIIKLVGAAVVVSVLGYVGYVFNDRESVKNELKQSKEQLEAAKQSLAEQIRNQELENWARGEYLKQLESAQSETKRLQTCVANKSCGISIRVRQQTNCPSVPGENNPAGTETTTASLDPDTERRYFDLRDGIVSLESKYQFCIQTLKNWETKPYK